VRFLALQTRIRELHSYDVPEIVAVPIEIGFDKYLQWVAQSV
jgi:periplasmic divalent cation tolerance protein